MAARLLAVGSLLTAVFAGAPDVLVDIQSIVKISSPATSDEAKHVLPLFLPGGGYMEVHFCRDDDLEALALEAAITGNLGTSCVPTLGVRFP